MKFAALVVLLYIDTLVCPLDQFNSTFQVIAEGTVEKVDPAKKVCIIKVGKALKGKPELTHIRVNIGTGQDWHPDAVLPHLVPGAPVLLWYYWGDGPKAAIYVNRFFLEAYRSQDPEGGKVWWNFSAIATLYNRTFNGTVDELTQALFSKPPPDPKLPCITRDSLAALKPGEKLPLPFRRRSAAGAAPRPPDGAPPPLTFAYYEGTWTSMPDFAKLKPVKTGAAKGLDLPPGRDAAYALRFTGTLDVPRDGVYTFTLASNDGAVLAIGDAVVVDNDHFKSVVESSGDIALKAGKHAFSLGYFQHSGFQVLEAFWEGPGLARRTLP